MIDRVSRSVFKPQQYNMYIELARVLSRLHITPRHSLIPGGIPIYKWRGVIVVPSLGVKIRGLVPFRVLEMTSVRGRVVPFRGLSRNIWVEVNASQLMLVVKNCSGHAHKTEFWYPLGVLFKISDDHPHKFYVPPPPPPPLPGTYHILHVINNVVPHYGTYCCLIPVLVTSTQMEFTHSTSQVRPRVKFESRAKFESGSKFYFSLFFSSFYVFWLLFSFIFNDVLVINGKN